MLMVDIFLLASFLDPPFQWSNCVCVLPPAQLEPLYRANLSINPPANLLALALHSARSREMTTATKFANGTVNEAEDIRIGKRELERIALAGTAAQRELARVAVDEAALLADGGAREVDEPVHRVLVDDGAQGLTFACGWCVGLVLLGLVGVGVAAALEALGQAGLACCCCKSGKIAKSEDYVLHDNRMCNCGLWRS